MKISVITPSFNQGDFIEATILSIINQTYKDIEYIIVDGGSTDNTLEIVNKYKDHISIFISEKDSGQSDAINKGFKLATGELVGWINSDDILYPDCIEKIVGLYNSKNDGAIYYNCNARNIDRNGNKLSDFTKRIPNRDYLLKINYDVIQPGSFYSMNMLRKIDYINTSLHYCMDLDLWLRLLENGPIYHLDAPPLSGFRIWENSKTSTSTLFFLKEIREVLLRNGARVFSRTVMKTYFCSLKKMINFFLRFHR